MSERLERVAPGLSALLHYRIPENLQSDFVAGLSVAAVALPVSVAYAELAGFNPVVGLYSSILPLVAYAVFGTSRQLIVNPDAVRNQLEGAVIQSTSRALIEEGTFDRLRVTSLDWASYPIIRFPDIPDEIDIVLANRPDLPPMRVGEPASETIWPAIANAIYDAVGIRLRRLPFTPSRVLAALNSG